MKFSLSRLFASVLRYLGDSSTLEIYTDGSSKDGLGSWSYVVSQSGKSIAENSGCVRHGNSNVMEFQAAIEALSTAPANSKVKLFSDSRILVDAMKFREGPNTYQTQIDTLLRLSQKHKIQWQWIKAHNGNKFNERCDELCILARTVDG